MTTSTWVKSFTNIGFTLTTLLIMGLATSGSATAQNILFEDNFDTENAGIPQVDYKNFAKWDVTDGSVDLIGSGTSSRFDFLPGNGFYLDMDGTNNDAGKLESKTTFLFNPGDIINLEFKLAGSQRNIGAADSVILSLGSLFTETFSLSPNQEFQTFVRNITVTSASSAKLVFEGTGNDNVGMLLDNVQLGVSPGRTTSVPDPSSILGVLAMGALGATSVLKGKNKRG